MSQDLYQLVNRLDELAGRPRQLPALFQPKTISPVLGEPEKQHPTHDYFVGGEGQEQPVSETIRKIGDNKWRLYSKDGSKNLGTFDSLAAAKKHEREVQYFKHMGEGVTSEDVISTVKKKLGDYLKNIEDEIRQDPDLKAKSPVDIDKIGPAVKTIHTDDGQEIRIHGNEDDGFRITIKNKQAKTRFRDLDEATMAVEMYCARRRGAVMEKDYLEER